MFQTLELGPIIDQRAPDFALLNHDHRIMSLEDLMGEHGLLLGFTGDIWQPASVRRILWLQRYAPRLHKLGVNIALLFSDKPHMLYGFYMSTPTPLGFPLLSDLDRDVHRRYNMERHAGLALINRELRVADKWLVPDERVWPQVQELIQACGHILT